jgi:hypothetical protein
MVAQSMSYGEGNGLKVLFEGTQHRDPRVVEASLKAIKNVLDCMEISREPIFREHRINLLVEFISLDRYAPKIVEMAIKLVSRCCEEHNLPNINYQKAIAKTGVINHLISLLLFSGIPEVSARETRSNTNPNKAGFYPNFLFFY